MIDNLLALRKEYKMAVLDEAHTSHLPMEQFKTWFGEAVESKIMEPNAMMLATVDAHGQPSARIVLVRDILSSGIGFYTNYESRKSRELEHQPKAAITFFWPELERQVRFEGVIEKMSREDSEKYFAQRPRGSQIGAWTSPQSEVIGSRNIIQQAEEKYQKDFEGKDVPCPPHWGGFLLKIHYSEFWQGRENRLHDRICYKLSKEGVWERFRIAP
ncbi:MAG: pyridoxamine 5'-phosphate oxidase [Bacteroidia bacterium]